MLLIAAVLLISASGELRHKVSVLGVKRHYRPLLEQPSGEANVCPQDLTYNANSNTSYPWSDNLRCGNHRARVGAIGHVYEHRALPRLQKPYAYYHRYVFSILTARGIRREAGGLTGVLPPMLRHQLPDSVEEDRRRHTRALL